MQFRIADTFTSSLGRLPNDQQRAAKTTAFDLQTNPSQPGLESWPETPVDLARGYTPGNQG